ncbi:DUF6882 domain-containing protein [Tenacibaculum jejuense]|uniref:Uncharacterized protein n=1 Tax=Tenacibaculum jejuense TaxID=584609 RepID=A0A238U8L7_9FLAO|nr:DUF6882 domain-containing protein [Tenacibaculum jejuense]SNR14834.1 conserved protein of unknown function [Tenacibaculum jejuense]
MGLFKKLFGKKEVIETPKLETENIDEKTGIGFTDLLYENAGLSFEKQIIFNEITGDSSWNINLNEGKLYFGELSFPIQVIGSLSFNDYSWMWGWANAKSGIPENLLVKANELKSFGEKHQIEEFIDGHFYVEEGFEHKMGMIAVGLLNADAYFCANYGQGTMVIAINSETIPKIEFDRLEKIPTTFPQLIGAIELDHKASFISYMESRKLDISAENNTIIASRNGKKIIASFDDLSRLKNLQAEL